MTGSEQTQNGPSDLSTRARILVIEDEPDMAELIGMHLRSAGEVTIANDGKRGLELAQLNTWELIILDLRLPHIDGLEICRELRNQKSRASVLMLTALSTELDKVVGLELGADDYLTKPFGVMELQARARALLRRLGRATEKIELENQKSPTHDDVIEIKNFRIDKSQHRAWMNDVEMKLTHREFELLWHFASHPNQVFSRGELLDRVWGPEHSGYEHTVNSHINRVRTKLARLTPCSISIDTVWGVGYRLASDASG